MALFHLLIKQQLLTFISPKLFILSEAKIICSVQSKEVQKFSTLHEIHIYETHLQNRYVGFVFFMIFVKLNLNCT